MGWYQVMGGGQVVPISMACSLYTVQTSSKKASLHRRRDRRTKDGSARCQVSLSLSRQPAWRLTDPSSSVLAPPSTTDTSILAAVAAIPTALRNAAFICVKMCVSRLGRTLPSTIAWPQPLPLCCPPGASPLGDPASKLPSLLRLQPLIESTGVAPALAVGVGVKLQALPGLASASGPSGLDPPRGPRGPRGKAGLGGCSARRRRRRGLSAPHIVMKARKLSWRTRNSKD